MTIENLDGKFDLKMFDVDDDDDDLFLDDSFDNNPNFLSNDPDKCRIAINIMADYFRPENMSRKKLKEITKFAYSLTSSKLNVVLPRREVAPPNQKSSSLTIHIPYAKSRGRPKKKKSKNQ